MTTNATTARLPALGHVLCPVDLSAHSQAALYLAAGLATHPESRLTVLRVEDRLFDDDELLAARTELNEFVGAAVPGAMAYRAATSIEVVSGKPVDAILSYADAHGARLIVMGTRGRGGLAHALLGSTTERVMRETPVPIAMVPPSDMEVITLVDGTAVPHLGIILVPVDLAAPSDTQLEWVSQFSAASDHRLLMLHVVPEGADCGLPLERLTTLAQATPTARGIRPLVVDGSVADEVVKVAARDPIGTIVLGRSGDRPGRLAYELVRRTTSVIVLVP